MQSYEALKYLDSPMYEDWNRQWRADQRERLLIELHAALAQELSDDELGGLGVEVVEPLVDMFWDEIADDFEQLAMRSPALRRAIRGAGFANPVADDRLRRFRED